MKKIKPLSMLSAGESGVIYKIVAGRGLTLRLVELGITPGIPIKVIHNNSGLTLLSIRGSRMAIGRGIAMKILVKVS